jgi:hypothetical protein
MRRSPPGGYAPADPRADAVVQSCGRAGASRSDPHGDARPRKVSDDVLDEFATYGRHALGNPLPGTKRSAGVCYRARTAMPGYSSTRPASS